MEVPPAEYFQRWEPCARADTLSWNDLVRGDQTVELGSLSDPVLIREDGTFLYTFTSVVDDIDFAITHVVRGEDHVTNTGVQMAIFEALGATPLAFGHHSLLVGADGHALSKRLGALSVQSFRDEGLEPMAVLCHAALVGTSDAIEPLTSRDELAAKLDFTKISTAPGRFDVADLKTLNGKLLHMLDYADVAERLEAFGVAGGEDFWIAVRGNLEVSPMRASGGMSSRATSSRLSRTRKSLLPALLLCPKSRGGTRPGRFGRRLSNRRRGPRGGDSFIHSGWL